MKKILLLIIFLFIYPSFSYSLSEVGFSVGDGSGDMSASTYDPQGVESNTFSRSNHTGTQPLSTISDAGTSASKDTGTAIGNVVEIANDGTGNPALPFALFDASGFTGNLATTDDTFDEVFDVLDGLSTGGGATPTVQSADPTSASSVGWYMATTSGDAFYKSAAGLFNVSAGTYTADPVNYTLTIDSTGWGSGDTVTGTGINCPGDCTEDYLDGTNVSLTAAAGTGRQFDGWTGALTGTTNPDSVAMTANRTVGANFSATGGGVTTFEDFEGTGTPTGWTVTHGTPDFDYTTTVFSGIESLYYNSAGNPMRFETSSLGVSGEVYIGFMVNMTAQGTSFEIRLRDTADNVLAVIDKGTVSDSLVVQVTGGTAYQTPTDSWQLSTTTYIKIRYKPSNGVDNAEIQGWTSTDGTTWTSTSATSTNATTPTANVDHLYFTCNFETITAVFDDIKYSLADFNF